MRYIIAIVGFMIVAGDANARCSTIRVCDADGCSSETTCTSEREQRDRDGTTMYNRQRGYQDDDPRGSPEERRYRARELQDPNYRDRNGDQDPNYRE